MDVPTSTETGLTRVLGRPRYSLGHRRKLTEANVTFPMACAHARTDALSSSVSLLRYMLALRWPAHVHTLTSYPPVLRGPSDAKTWEQTMLNLDKVGGMHCHEFALRLQCVLPSCRPFIDRHLKLYSKAPPIEDFYAWRDWMVMVRNCRCGACVNANVCFVCVDYRVFHFDTHCCSPHRTKFIGTRKLLHPIYFVLEYCRSSRTGVHQYA